jgi:hypothetical protein
MSQLQNSPMSADEIKQYIIYINELDTLSINSHMPIDKLGISQRQSLFKQFNKYMPIHVKTVTK